MRPYIYYKGNPRWVREGRGTKNHGKFRWEYQKDGKYYAEGFYHTAQEAHEACLNHQKKIDIWKNPEKYSGVIFIDDRTSNDPNEEPSSISS